MLLFLLFFFLPVLYVYQVCIRNFSIGMPRFSFSDTLCLAQLPNPACGFEGAVCFFLYIICPFLNLYFLLFNPIVYQIDCLPSFPKISFKIYVASWTNRRSWNFAETSTSWFDHISKYWNKITLSMAAITAAPKVGTIYFLAL